MKYEVINNQKIDTKDKTNYLELIKSGLNELGRKKWKYIFIVLYTNE